MPDKKDLQDSLHGTLFEKSQSEAKVRKEENSLKYFQHDDIIFYLGEFYKVNYRQSACSKCAFTEFSKFCTEVCFTRLPSGVMAIFQKITREEMKKSLQEKKEIENANTNHK